jgi:hypothetical protein
LYVDFALYEKIKEKKYGDKYIVIYKNNLWLIEFNIVYLIIGDTVWNWIIKVLH